MKEQIKKQTIEIDEDIDNLIFIARFGIHRQFVEALYNKGYRKQTEGEWEDQYQGMYANQLYKCSICRETAFHDDKKWFLTNYCPNCGAKMKGGGK